MRDKKFKIYLCFCIAMFFILLSVVLFYSFGYRYDIKKGETRQTGAIVIKAHTENVDIYINNQLYRNNKTLSNLFNDFIKIEGLNPGIYNIKVKKENYFDWEKNARVKGGYVTEFKNIVLAKRRYNENVLLDKLETDINLGQHSNIIWVSNDENKIAYGSRNGKKLNLLTFNLKSKEQRIIIDSNYLLKKNKNDYSFDDVIWSDDDKKIMVKISDNGNVSWYLVDLENKGRIYNLSVIFEKNQAIKNKWNLYLKSDFLFYLKDNTLYRFDYTKLVSKKMLENISGFLVEGDYIYYLSTKDNNLRLTGRQNLLSPRTILKMPEEFDSRLLSRIVKSNKNVYLVLSNSDKLYFIDENNKITFINSPVKNAYFSNNDQRIIYYNSHEVSVYYLEEKISQPPKKEFTNELITRYSQDISNIYLFEDEEHLFYKEGNVLKFAELDNRDKRNVFDILESDNDIFYLRSKSLLLYIKNGKLMQIKLEE
jgi:hypothetical protein